MIFICGMSMKNRRLREDAPSLLSIQTQFQSVADVGMRHGRLNLNYRAMFMDVSRILIWGKRLTPASMHTMNIFKIYGNDDNVQVKFDYFEKYNDGIDSIRILSRTR